MDPNATKDLLERYLSGTAGPEEAALVTRWYEQQQDASLDDQQKQLIGAALYQQILRHPDFTAAMQPLADDPASITYPQAPVHRIHFLKTTWFRYAAVLLLIAGTTTFIYTNYHRPVHEVVKSPDARILPGGNKATLTLADGTTIVLDSAANGSLAQQGNADIIKLGAGSLAYNTAKTPGDDVLYNIISTPKGGQYQVTLADGTKVWLNAASSIRFPASFKKERTVSITGEAYFEVHPDKSMPFKVSVNNMKVDVLGTSFNINAYADEPAVKTSLLEGTVKIGTSLLKPGEAFIDGKIITTNIEQDLAWKNGVFYFYKADIPTVMRQLARWYNVEIVYHGKVPSREFKGEIGRDLNLSDVVELLKKSGIPIRIEDQKLIIVP